MYMHLIMAAHVVNLIRTANFGLPRFCSVCHYRCSSHQNSSSLPFVHDWTIRIPSSLDAPSTFNTDFKRLKKNAARLILKSPRTGHIPPHLCTLHWLPVDARIKHEMFSLCFGAIISSGPVCLSDLHTLPAVSIVRRQSYTVRAICRH